MEQDLQDKLDSCRSFPPT